MKVLVGCEESQALTIALRNAGHEAYSCDLLPCSGGHPEWHIQGDIIQVLISMDNIDMFIYFPDCTYITVSGLHWNKRVPGRSQKTESALSFVARCYNIAIDKGIKKIGFENPIGCISTRIIKDTTGHLIVVPIEVKGNLKPSQVIQPYYFGHDASKATCLWLEGLPNLKNTEYVKPRLVCSQCKNINLYDSAFEKGCTHCGAEPSFLKPRWENQTDSGQNKLPPSEDRAKLRSKTYSGIAEAMATQWNNFNKQEKLNL